MIKIIRDLNSEFRFTNDQLAVLVTFDPPTPNGKEMFCVAWGQPAEDLYNGVRPLGWTDDMNTCDDGCEWYDTLEEAEAAIAAVDEAHAQTETA